MSAAATSGKTSSAPPNELKKISLTSVVKKIINGYVGFNNLPNQIHRRYVSTGNQLGFQFTLMIVGESGLGKTTLVNTLFNTQILPPKTSPPVNVDDVKKSITVEDHIHHLEENSVKLKLTVVDVPGFGDALNNEDSWRPILENIEARYDSYMEHEFRVERKDMKDDRVHACLYFIAPSGHSLSTLDVEFMKNLGSRVNIIPVIGKADTLTEEELTGFKARIMEDIAANKIEIFRPVTHSVDDAATQEENMEIMSKIPFAVVGSTTFHDVDGKRVRGRKYPWGVIQVDNEEHCDFIKVRQLLIRSYMEELREQTNMVLYETYRTAKITESGGITGWLTSSGDSNTMARLEQSKLVHDQKMAKMEAEMRSVFQQKVNEKEAKLKQSESELYARHKEMKDQLEKQRADLEERIRRLDSRPGTPSRPGGSWKKPTFFNQ